MKWCVTYLRNGDALLGLVELLILPFLGPHVFEVSIRLVLAVPVECG